MATAIDLPFVQELCDLVGQELGHGCSIMGERGVILASSARQRVGQVHAGAARVMRGELGELSVSADEARQSSGGMLEGVVVGIDVEGRRVGCCGIAGPLDRVAPLARMIALVLRATIHNSQAIQARSEEIAQQVSRATNIAAAAVDASRQTDSAMNQLTEAIARIGQVAKFIKAIASQTNLLALNATIESARAGDAGKGFAVVANEVKQLATQTAKATGDITGQIEQVQSSSTDVRRTISIITTTINEVNEVIASVARAMETKG